MMVIPSSSASAEQNIESEGIIKTAGYTKEIIHPDNQLDDGEALNLMMKPGQKQTVVVKLTNLGSEELELNVNLNGAKTNGDGKLEFGPSSFKEAKSTVYDLSDLVEVPKTIQLKGYEKKDLILEINMPENSFDGIVTGGVQLIEKEQATEKSPGMSIVNKISYLFGVTLRMTNNQLTPDFQLGSIYIDQLNYQETLFVELSNTQSMYVKDLEADVVVTRKGQLKPIWQRKEKAIEMAPNSLMAYTISMKDRHELAGTYTAHITLKGYQKSWSWEQDFSIKRDNAGIYQTEKRNTVHWQRIAFGVLLVFGFAILVFYKQKKQKQRKKKR